MKINLNLQLKNEWEKETILTPKKRDDQGTGILIIEDEKVWRQLYKLNLLKKPKNKRRKYTFYEAFNGREGIKLIAQHYSQIKIILLDLVMEKMEGMEVLKLLVDQWGFLNLGIFILTAYGTDETMVDSQLRGVRGFYDKNNLDFEKLSSDLEFYLDSYERPQAIASGFYVESRPHESKDYSYVFLRWSSPEREGGWETFCLGRSDELGTEPLDLPNIKSKDN